MKTIKLNVEKSYFKDSSNPSVRYYINDVLFCGTSYNLSRILTNTDFESGRGIFTKSVSGVNFHRLNKAVSVDFEPFDLSDYSHSASEIMAEIKKRAKTINDAFDRKYPVAIEACEETFEIH